MTRSESSETTATSGGDEASETGGSDGSEATGISDEDILFFFEEGPRPFYSASEVGEAFDWTRQHARRRLEAIASDEESRLHRGEVGQRNVVYWIDREVVTLRPDTDGWSAHDTTLGVASGGDSRADALEALAEAIRSHESSEAGTVDST